MLRLIFFLVAFSPMLLYPQTRIDNFEKEISKFINANNILDCGKLASYCKLAYHPEQMNDRDTMTCEICKLKVSNTFRRTLDEKFIIEAFMDIKDSRYGVVKIPITYEIDCSSPFVIDQIWSDAFYNEWIVPNCSRLDNSQVLVTTQFDESDKKMFCGCDMRVFVSWEDDKWTITKLSGLVSDVSFRDMNPTLIKH